MAVRLVGESQAEVGRDLFRAPLVLKLALNLGPTRHVDRQTGPAWSRPSVSRSRVGEVRVVRTTVVLGDVALELAADGGHVAVQPSTNLSHAYPLPVKGSDPLPFEQRQIPVGAHLVSQARWGDSTDLGAPAIAGLPCDPY
jgi:hypothetical protein